jgi:hypothetical protein
MFPWNSNNWLSVPRGVIYETIVTTQDDDRTNFAPMGAWFEDEGVIIRPFRDTRTFQLLKANQECVVNICWDVRPFVIGALKCNIEDYSPSFVDSIKIHTKRLSASIAWLECSVQSIDSLNSSDRCRVILKILHHGNTGQIICPNRADAAILEATIHSTRMHLSTDIEEEKELKSRVVAFLRLAGRISTAQHHRTSIAAIAREIGLREGEIAARGS